MYSDEHLKAMFEDEGIAYLQVDGSRACMEESMLTFAEGHIDTLLNFAKSNNINTVFYSKAFYNPEMFMITDEETKGLDPDIYEIVKSHIAQHNQAVEKEEFEVPIRIDVFCLYEGHKVGVAIEKEWFFDIDPVLGSEKLIEILKACEAEIMQLADKKQVYEADLRSELQELILKDENFAIQTNQNLRKEYLYNILKRKNMKKYHPIFEMREGYLNPHKIQNFIDLVWKIYKYEKA